MTGTAMDGGGRWASCGAWLKGGEGVNNRRSLLSTTLMAR